MEVAQLRRDVSTDGGVVELSTTDRLRSVVIPKREALPRIAYGDNQQIALEFQISHFGFVAPCHSKPYHTLIKVHPLVNSLPSASKQQVAYLSALQA